MNIKLHSNLLRKLSRELSWTKPTRSCTGTPHYSKASLSFFLFFLDYHTTIHSIFVSEAWTAPDFEGDMKSFRNGDIFSRWFRIFHEIIVRKIYLRELHDLWHIRCKFGWFEKQRFYCQFWSLAELKGSNSRNSWICNTFTLWCNNLLLTCLCYEFWITTLITKTMWKL